MPSNKRGHSFVDFLTSKSGSCQQDQLMKWNIDAFTLYPAPTWLITELNIAYYMQINMSNYLCVWFHYVFCNSKSTLRRHRLHLMVFLMVFNILNIHKHNDNNSYITLYGCLFPTTDAPFERLGRFHFYLLLPILLWCFVDELKCSAIIYVN